MVSKVLQDVAKHIAIRPQYENFIGGKWVAPVRGQYFDNVSPINGQVVCKIARSTAEDIELALDAAHKAKDAWGRTSPAERALVLLRIADRMQEKLDLLAMVETIDNGKPIREIDRRRPAARQSIISAISQAALRTQEGGISRDRSRHGRLSFPRAARRRRPDHSVEFPDPDGGCGSWAPRRLPPATASF